VPIIQHSRVLVSSNIVASHRRVPFVREFALALVSKHWCFFIRLWIVNWSIDARPPGMGNVWYLPLLTLILVTLCCEIVTHVLLWMTIWVCKFHVLYYGSAIWVITSFPASIGNNTVQWAFTWRDGSLWRSQEGNSCLFHWFPVLSPVPGLHNPLLLCSSAQP